MTLLPADLGVDPAPFHHEIVRLLGEGRIAEAHERLRDGAADDLFVALATADADLRLLDVDIADLRALQERVEAGTRPDSPLVLWARTLVCERLVLELDAVGAIVARNTLDGLPDDPLPDLLTLYCRARLTRVVAWAWITVTDPSERKMFLSHRDAAVQDLMRCGFTAEAAWTRGFAAALRAVVWGDHVTRDLATIQSARRLLHEESVSSVLFDWFIAPAAFHVGDLELSYAAARRVEASVIQTPFLACQPQLIRLLSRIVAFAKASDDDITALEDTLHVLGEVNVRLMFAFQELVVAALLDIGDPRATRLGWNALDVPATGAWHEVGREGLRWRLKVSDGLPADVGELQELLDEVVRQGRSRGAGGLALQAARDLERVDRSAEAAALREWGLERIPPEGQRLLWEQLWAQPVSGQPPQEPVIPVYGEPEAGNGIFTPVSAMDAGDRADDSAAVDPRPGVGQWASGSTTPLLAIRVLTPALETDVAGEPVVLTGLGARLVLLLAIHHPTPLHVEQVVDALWSDCPVAMARSRLNTVVHRVRRLLGLPDGVLMRVGELVSLAPDAVAVDHADWQRAVLGPPDGQLEALVGTRGDLCGAQFPYDEAFMNARHSFVARWVEVARSLIEKDPEARFQLVPAAANLGIDAADLGGVP